MLVNIRKLKRKIVRSLSKFWIRSRLSLEKIPCPACGNENNFTVLQAKDRYGLPITTVRCPKCSLAFSNPAPTGLFLKTFYGTSMFRGLDWGILKPTRKILQEFNAKNRAMNHLLFFDEIIFPKFHNSARSILDIGSSDGTFLLEFSNKYSQVLCFGVEPGKLFRNHSEKQLTRVFDSLEEISKDETFDYITAWHVLEHSRDPKLFLKRVRDHMSDSSLLIFEVPDFDRYDNSIRPFHIDHICHFNETVIRRILTDVGLSVLGVYRENKYLSDNIYGIKLIAKRR